MATLRVETPAYASFSTTADDGVQLEGLRLGAGQPPIVYCVPHPADPRLLLSTPAMAALATRIAGQHTFIVPAPRWSGGSDARGPIQMARLAADVAALLGAADVGPALVWGRRLGGVIALELGRRFPALVAGVVLDNLIVHPALGDLFGGVPSRYDRLPAGERDAAVREAVAAAFQSHFAGADPAALAPFLDQVLASAPLHVWAHSLQDAVRCLQTPTRVVGLARLEQPLLLLAAPDGVVPGERVEFTMLRRLATNATVRDHPAGAAAHQDNSTAVHRTVMDWWREQG